MPRLILVLQEEAAKNQKISLVSKLHRDGKLDVIYKGTIASRRLIAVCYALHHNILRH